MLTTIINTTISTVVGLLIGFLIGKIKEYNGKIKDEKANNIIQNEALKLLLQNALTNAFFVYEETKMMKDYQYKSWINMFKIYKALGGNDYIDELNNRIKKFEIEKTGIMK